MPKEPREELQPGAGGEIVPTPSALEPPLDGVASDATEPQTLELPMDPARFVVTVGILTYISALAVTAEYSNYNEALPTFGEEIASGLAHPLLGYLGGAAGSLATLERSRGIRAAAIVLGATAANFATEKAQSILVASPEFIDFTARQNLPETGKDYAFALLGAALLAFQSRRRNP